MFCQRCGHIRINKCMSIFTIEKICTTCKQKEINNPRYEEALLAQIYEIESGNYNFKGIGFV